MRVCSSPVFIRAVMRTCSTHETHITVLSHRIFASPSPLHFLLVGGVTHLAPWHVGLVANTALVVTPSSRPNLFISDAQSPLISQDFLPPPTPISSPATHGKERDSGVITPISGTLGTDLCSGQQVTGAGRGRAGASR